MRGMVPLLMLFLIAPLGAAEMRVDRDVPYTENPHERQRLDVYAAVDGKEQPIIVWIHGGGWQRGDKGRLLHKPQAFVDRGYVLVSVNYRLRPEVTVADMTQDIARAVRWVHDHAGKYGGSARQIFVAGHSAGAHLAALLCTDEQYLQQAGLSLGHIQGCIPIDVSVYDIPRRLQAGGSVPAETFTAIFGETEDEQRLLSPVAHVAREKGIPAFLILHVARRQETTEQSHWLAKQLQQAGVSARVVAGEGKTHATINTELGLPEDPPTLALFEFLTSQTQAQPE